MDNLSLQVGKRTDTGKGGVRRIRRSGGVPAVVYGIRENTPLTVNPKELESLLSTRAGANVVFQLNVEGEDAGERPVIVKELQRDPMQGTILHADFLEIRMDEKITVSVPLVNKGESPGVKLGGVLSQLLRELEVTCLPNAIPEEVSVDISDVEIGDVIHVRDLVLPSGAGLVTDLEDPVLTVVVPTEEEEEVPEEELAEGEAPAEGEEAATPAAEEGDAQASSEESS